MSNVTKENKPRDYLDMEDDFCHRCNIISVTTDLLFASDNGKDLADDTLEKLGFTLSREITEIRAMFYELIENQKTAKQSGEVK